MKKILTILFVLASLVSLGQVKHKEKFGVYAFKDSVYFMNVPYSASASIVHLGLDTLVSSPTYGKLVRKTAGGATPTLQQVFNTEVGGSVMTKNDTIETGNFILWLRKSTGSSTAFAIEGQGAVGLNVSTTGSSSAIIGSGGDGGALGASLSIAPSATNTFLPILRINRQTSGTAANGLGGYVQFTNEAADGAQYVTARVGSVHTDVTNKSGELQFWTSLTNTEAVRATLSNTGLTLTTRLKQQQGADVASVAGAIALGTDGNTFEITGTNAITLISNLNWQNGSEVTLIFTSTASLTDGTANSGTDIGFELAANANFTASADDTITLILTEIGGVQRWREKCRSIN